MFNVSTYTYRQQVDGECFRGLERKTRVCVRDDELTFLRSNALDIRIAYIKKPFRLAFDDCRTRTFYLFPPFLP